MDATNIISQRNKTKFASGGFMYVLDKVSKDGYTEFWRCERRGQCKGRIHVREGNVVHVVNDHSHEANAAKIEADNVVGNIKRRAGSTLESTSQVINSCTENLTLACQGALPKQDALKRIVRRVRNEVISAPPNPSDLTTLVIPDAYKIIKMAGGTEENFLLFDSGPEHDRILIFGKEENLRTFKDCENFFMDGTFKISPPLFCQVFVILVKKHGGVHPMFYALLPNKQRATYEKLFRAIKNLQPELQPNSISCDFEAAILKSVSEVFPNAQIHGCFFHLAQNMKKHLCSLGLINNYNTNAEFALFARMITALAFVPVQDIDEAIDVLGDVIPEDLRPLLDWLEDNYVGRPNRRGQGRRRPLFAPETWNVYSRTINSQDRTNNFAEAAHRRLQVELGMNHPTIWKFINALKTIQHGRDLFYEQLIAGHNPPQKLKRYKDADERILLIVNNYDGRNIIEYLRGIAHNFEME